MTFGTNAPAIVTEPWLLRYQNIFTQVQVQGEPRNGDGYDRGAILGGERTKKAGFSTLAGWFGNAQLGPIYLGWAGIVSLATGPSGSTSSASTC
jgi:photosynthetic reaction center M subunit